MQLADLQARLKIGCRFVDAHPKWVETDNLHLTLLFIGNINKTRIAELAEIADGVAAEMDPFDVVVARLGLFPADSKEPKVLSIDVRGMDKSLQRLHARLHDALSQREFDLERRPYKPHLTLARITSIKTGSRLAPLAASHANKLQTKFTASEVVLFESQLQAEGSTYNDLHTSKFTSSSATHAG